MRYAEFETVLRPEPDPVGRRTVDRIRDAFDNDRYWGAGTRTGLGELDVARVRRGHRSVG